MSTVSTFVINATNSGNVTQQRLQGNTNALAIQSLQTQVSDLSETVSGQTALTTVTNTNGSYFQLSDGTLVQWGTAPSVSGGGVAPVKTLPTPFADTKYVMQLTMSNAAGNIASTVVSLTDSTFTYRVDALIFFGGGGSPSTGSEIVMWFAIGM